ncbi:hypothetical protein ACFORG_00245 [Lutimaribacter marinistellae]|uniref:Tripartite tricarboxylate transporter TctB family protein n=1 Tax=Lutimaribacter marinistellae TaxID=1820329 RepID=A0ABV7T9E5_9RHOB
MRPFVRANVILGVSVSLAALAIALIWVPLDTDTGLIEKVRRRLTVGDALAPTVAAAFLLLGGLIVTFFERPENARRLSAQNLAFLAILLTLLTGAFLVMRWMGPGLLALISEDGYRPLRDTAPWKYIGFLTGGTVMIAGLIAMVEGRLSLRGIAIGVVAALALIVLYDLPFDDLLLPPNGDV